MKNIQTDSAYIERRGRKDNRRRELAWRVATDIRNGKLSGKLPGVNRLASLYDSCPATMQRVLQLLAEEGLVDVRPCSGSYVRSLLEVSFVVIYIPALQRSSISEARDNALANYEQLYQGVYDTLKASGIPLNFQMLELGDGEQLRRMKRGNHHFVAVFPPGQENICYEFLAGCSWTRLMGEQDYNCPVAHFTYDNLRIGELAAHELRERKCSRFVFIGSCVQPLFRQRLDTFRTALARNNLTAEVLDVDFSRMELPEIVRRMRSFVVETVEMLRSGEVGLFCSADVFLITLYQVLAPMLEPGAVRIVSCDNNPYYLKGLFPVPREIDICTYEIGAQAARHILTSPDSVEKAAIIPRLV